MKRAIALVAVSIVIGGLVTYSASGATRPLTGGTGAQSRATAPITHWCNTNGITCIEPSQNWEEFAKFGQLKQHGVNIQPYIGHDEPSVLFFSSDTGSNPHYIGRHPGTAYMEMQFYPPGYVSWPLGISCDAHRWCAAINI